MESLKKLVILFFFFVIPCVLSAQKSNYADSILTQLRLIKDSTDTIHLRQAIDLMFRNKSEVLIENSPITSELNRLKPILDEKIYYTLLLFFYRSHFNLDRIPNEALIKFGRDFIEKNKGGYSPESKNLFLDVLRMTRIPYRNSSHLNEGIEYYSGLCNYFAEKNNRDAASVAYSVLAGFYSRTGLMPQAEYFLLKSNSFLDDNPRNDTLYNLLGASGKANRYLNLGSVMMGENKPQAAEKYIRLGIDQFNRLRSPLLYGDAPDLFLLMARVKTLLKSDSSSYYYSKVYNLLNLRKAPPLGYAWYYIEKGKDFLSKNENDSAAYYFTKAKFLKENQHLSITSPSGELIPDYYTALLSLQQNKAEQAIQLLLPEIQELRGINANVSLIKELQLLAKAYAVSGKYKEGFEAQTELLGIKDTLARQTEDARSLNFTIEKKMQENEKNIALLNAKDEAGKKTKNYLYGIAVLLGLFTVTLGIAIVSKQKSNARLTAKNTEVVNAMDQLKQTQKQLIQSEKMASLGELTAGIAHEIQNPLNFVNNFSDINQELIGELQEDLKSGNVDDAVDLSNDIKSNSEKINHHGKRADAIVKGMLQHSRSSSGVKEPADINALCDEYLRLSYHGLRAKDKSFHATMETKFDENIGKINVVPQDIGRVLLNIINNAFFAVNERGKNPQGFGNLEGLRNSYSPTVTVSTKKTGNSVTISVRDNGSGIPEKIKDKIFQPFFTTKPTGSGTGLGLSLAYDIIKAHGGEMKVNSKEGEFTEFIVQLPA